jgi:hypothetical protein
MKHVGKMKNNGAKVVVVFRTLPGDPYNSLVVGTGNLGESYHDALMSLIQDPSGQQANELGEILAVRKFPDGNTMLTWLHSRNHLKKIPTNMVIMTPTANDTLPLDELNKLIAEQRGITLEELAVQEDLEKQVEKPKKSSDEFAKTTSKSVSGEIEEPEIVLPVKTDIEAEPLTPAQLRSKADKLFKEAQLLRKQADEIDPPKSKKKQVLTDAE